MTTIFPACLKFSGWELVLRLETFLDLSLPAVQLCLRTRDILSTSVSKEERMASVVLPVTVQAVLTGTAVLPL
jgi:hypothetical protein